MMTYFLHYDSSLFYYWREVVLPLLTIVLPVGAAIFIYFLGRHHLRKDENKPLQVDIFSSSIGPDWSVPGVPRHKLSVFLIAYNRSPKFKTLRNFQFVLRTPDGPELKVNASLDHPGDKPYINVKPEQAQDIHAFYLREESMNPNTFSQVTIQFEEVGRSRKYSFGVKLTEHLPLADL